EVDSVPAEWWFGFPGQTPVRSERTDISRDDFGNVTAVVVAGASSEITTIGTGYAPYDLDDWLIAHPRLQTTRSDTPNGTKTVTLEMTYTAAGFRDVTTIEPGEPSRERRIDC